MRIVGRMGSSESGRRCQMRAGRWEGREGSSSANLEPPPPAARPAAPGAPRARPRLGKAPRHREGAEPSREGLGPPASPLARTE